MERQPHGDEHTARNHLGPGQKSTSVQFPIPPLPYAELQHYVLDIKQQGGDEWQPFFERNDPNVLPQQFNVQINPDQTISQLSNTGSRRLSFRDPYTIYVSEIFLEKRGKYCAEEFRKTIPNLSPELLPETWQGLMPYSQIEFDQAGWLELKSGFPKRLTAIRKWVQAGGVLVVSEIESFPFDGNLHEGFCAEPDQPFPLAKHLAAPELAPQLMFANLGQGRVYFFEKTDLLLNRLGNDKLLFPTGGKADFYSGGLRTQERRLGLSGHFAYDFSIPGVGRPPVVVFGILIVGFVFAIGPANYWFFSRRKQLYLILLTIPLFSLLACLSLIFYAVLMDGFRINTRIRSITVLDQASGHFDCYSRHQMLGGSVPADGYTFDESDLVFVSREFGGQPLSYSFGDNLQQVSGGDIRARTEHQIVRHRNSQTNSRIEVQPTSDGGFEVTNSFQQKITHLEVCLSGQLYKTADLEPGTTKTLQPFEASLGASQLRDRIDIDREVGQEVQSYNRDFYEYSYELLPENEIVSTFQFTSLLQTNMLQPKPDTDVYRALFESDFELCQPIEPTMNIRKQFHVVLGYLGRRSSGEAVE